MVAHCRRFHPERDSQKDCFLYDRSQYVYENKETGTQNASQKSADLHRFDSGNCANWQLARADLQLFRPFLHVDGKLARLIRAATPKWRSLWPSDDLTQWGTPKKGFLFYTTEAGMSMKTNRRIHKMRHKRAQIYTDLTAEIAKIGGFREQICSFFALFCMLTLSLARLIRAAAPALKG